MPKAHNIGPLFIQVTKFPYEWGFKLVVKGWTQEIEPPYRTSTPVIVRLPSYRALVIGRWTGQRPEEEALGIAIQRRDVTYDDFSEEAGWTPAPDSDREEGSDYLNARSRIVDGTGDVHDWQTHNGLAENAERS